jgi:hypothetical protein
VAVVTLLLNELPRMTPVVRPAMPNSPTERMSMVIKISNRVSPLWLYRRFINPHALAHLHTPREMDLHLLRTTGIR